MLLFTFFFSPFFKAYHAMRKITAVEVANFRKNGYVYLKAALPDRHIDLLRTCAERSIHRRGSNQLPAWDRTPAKKVLEAPAAAAPVLAQRPITTALNIDPHAPKSKRKVKHTIASRLRRDETFVKKEFGIDLRKCKDPSLLNLAEVFKTREASKVSRAKGNVGVFNFDNDPNLVKMRKQLFLHACMSHVSTWFYTAYENDVFRGQMLAGEFGRGVGEAASQLMGTLSVRYFSDALVVRPPMSNWSPVSLDTRAMSPCITAIVPISSSSATANREPFLTVLKGSHHMTRDIIQSGGAIAMDSSPYTSQPFLQRSPEIFRRFPPEDLPYPDKGDVLFYSEFLLKAMHPLMSVPHGAAVGSMSNVASLLEQCPAYYSLVVIPENSTYDGVNRGWLTEDSHGPLFKYVKGQTLNDNNKFPVLYSYSA